MKIGDKVYCTKSRYNEDDLVNESGKNYKILKIVANNNIFLSSNLNENNTLFYYRKDKDNYHYFFYDYFLDSKEYRKRKLEKLNEYK